MVGAKISVISVVGAKILVISVVGAKMSVILVVGAKISLIFMFSMLLQHRVFYMAVSVMFKKTKNYRQRDPN